jgi:hypothetical protein
VSLQSHDARGGSESPRTAQKEKSMSDNLDIFRNGIRRFRSGGVAVAILPLVLGITLLLTGSHEIAVQMIILSVVLLFLILWAIHCAEDVVSNLQAGRTDRQ